MERTVERAIQIISEAVKCLPAEQLTAFSDIEWHKIIGIGNHLRHEYYRISPRVIWEIATVHLPILKPVIESMLRELDR